jgi:hypothetical protein
MLRSLLPALALLFTATVASSDTPKQASVTSIREQLAERELALEARAVDLERRAAELERRAAELDKRASIAGSQPGSSTAIPATKTPPPSMPATTPPGLPPETTDCKTLLKREAERVATLQAELKRLSRRLK